MSKLLEKQVYCFVFLILFSGICSSEVSKGEVTESVDGGIINYTTGMIRATGIAAPPEDAQNTVQKRSMAKVAAVTAARKKLLETLLNARIDSENIIENIDDRDELIKTQINGFIENSQEVEVKEYPDGSVEVTVEMSLRGQLSKALFKNIGSLIPTDNLNVKQNYTGLIIDCVGLGVKPAMIPKILNEGEKEIYGTSYVLEEYAVKQGIVVYTKSLSAAVTNGRVGANPIIIKGLIPDGRVPVNIIINSSDADKLEVINKTHIFLRQCRVIFVI